MCSRDVPTQEDPIGVAGGLNLYGYAGGDPVNFSDPLGLCPGIPNTNQLDPTDCPPGYFTVLFTAAGGAGGGLAGAISAGVACSPSGPAALVCAAGGAAGGAKAGAAAGALLGSGLDAGLAFAKMLDRLGGGELDIPGNPFTGANAQGDAFKHLAKYHGVSETQASDRLHKIKKAAGLGGADDVIFGRTGDVYNASTGEHIGNLATKY